MDETTEEVTSYPTLYPQLWALILFRLCDECDASHWQVIAQNERLFTEALARRKSTTVVEMQQLDFDYTMPVGFKASLRAMSQVRMVCKSWSKILEDNAWWYTYWSKRGIRDIREFKPSRVSWWEVAKRFHSQREEVRAGMEQRYPLERKHFITCNNRGLVWSMMRGEFEGFFV